MGKIPFYNGFAGRDSGFAEKRRVFLDTDGKTSEQLERQIADAIETQRNQESGLDSSKPDEVAASLKKAFESRDDLKKRLAEVNKKLAGSVNGDIATKWKTLKEEGLKQLKAKEEAIEDMQGRCHPLRILSRLKIKTAINGKKVNLDKKDTDEIDSEAREMIIEQRLGAEYLKKGDESEIKWAFEAVRWNITDKESVEAIGKETQATEKAKLIKIFKQRFILRELLKESDLRDIKSGGELSPEIRALLYQIQQDSFVDGLAFDFEKVEDGDFDNKGELKKEGKHIPTTLKKLLEEVTGNPELTKKGKEANKKKTEAKTEVDKLLEDLNGGSGAAGMRTELDELERDEKTQQDAIDAIDEKLGKFAEIKTKEVEEASAKSKVASTEARLQRLNDEKNQLPNQLRIQKIEGEMTAIDTEIKTLSKTDNDQTSRLRNSRRLSGLAAKGGLNSDQINNLRQQFKDLENRADNLRAEDIAYAKAKDTAITEATAILKDESEKLTVIQAQLAGLRIGETENKLKSDKREAKKDLNKIERKLAEKKKEIEKKEKALSEAKEKLEEAEKSTEAIEKEMKEWKDANGDKTKKLSAAEIAIAGQTAFFIKQGFEKETAERAARLRVNMDIIAAREGEATQRNLEFLEGVAKEKNRTNTGKQWAKGLSTLGGFTAKEYLFTPMRGKKLIENIAKEFKQEGKLEMHLNYRELAKLKLSEEQLVLLYGACEHALKHEKLDIGDRVALSRLSSNAKRLILQARVGTDRENESIEKISIADYNKFTKGVKDGKDEKHGESHEGGEGHSDKKSMLDRYNAGGKSLYGRFLGRLAAKKGGGGAAHKEH